MGAQAVLTRAIWFKHCWSKESQKRHASHPASAPKMQSNSVIESAPTARLSAARKPFGIIPHTGMTATREPDGLRGSMTTVCLDRLNVQISASSGVDFVGVLRSGKK